MGRWTYLMIDLAAVIVPFTFSFHPRLRFHREWYRLWPAMLAVAAAFIAWDAAFVRLGVWGFGTRYITGPCLFGLPVEEMLFFICIPYACLFTYHAFGRWKPDPWAPGTARWIMIVMALSLLTVGAMNLDRWYTGVTFTALGLVLLWLVAFVRPIWAGRFLMTFLMILLPFILVNGSLTGAWIEGEVVWYNDAENLGLRLGTIPVEDVFYGMLLLLLIVVAYEGSRVRVQ